LALAHCHLSRLSLKSCRTYLMGVLPMLWTNHRSALRTAPHHGGSIHVKSRSQLFLGREYNMPVPSQIPTPVTHWLPPFTTYVAWQKGRWKMNGLGLCHSGRFMMPFAGDAKCVFHSHTTDIYPARFPSMLEPRHDLTFPGRPLYVGRLPPPGAIVTDHERSLGETIVQGTLVGAALAIHTWSTSPSFYVGCSPGSR